MLFIFKIYASNLTKDHFRRKLLSSIPVLTWSSSAEYPPYLRAKITEFAIKRGCYEVDELQTFIGKNEPSNYEWITYAFNQESSMNSRGSLKNDKVALYYPLVFDLPRLKPACLVAFLKLHYQDVAYTLLPRPNEKADFVKGFRSK